jgi:hypothetical protein
MASILRGPVGGELQQMSSANSGNQSSHFKRYIDKEGIKFTIQRLTLVLGEIC